MNNTVNRKEFFKAQFEKRVHAHFFSTASLSAKPNLNDAMKSSDEQADALSLEKMSTLFIKLIEDMEHFIETNGTHADAKCSPALLGQAVVHFFADQSHQLFEPGDDLKAYAHLAYWLLKTKPIQIQLPEESNLTAALSDDRELQTCLYLNEKFTATFLLSYLVDDLTKQEPAKPIQQEQLSQALKEMTASFKYQPCSPTSLEVLFAGVLNTLHCTTE